MAVGDEKIRGVVRENVGTLASRESVVLYNMESWGQNLAFKYAADCQAPVWSMHDVTSPICNRLDRMPSTSVQGRIAGLQHDHETSIDVPIHWLLPK
jgi:hypothetical protein